MAGGEEFSSESEALEIHVCLLSSRSITLKLLPDSSVKELNLAAERSLAISEVKDSRTFFFVFVVACFFFAEITTQLHQFGCFLKWWYPQTIILIGFSIIFTIHFGVSLFLETPICKWLSQRGGSFMMSPLKLFTRSGRALPAKNGTLRNSTLLKKSWPTNALLGVCSNEI